MIDTDKYKDARKQAWRDAWGQPYFELNEMQRFISDNGPNSCNNSDVELWADAPLLLEEVKHLRQLIKKIKDCAAVNAQHDDILEKQEWKYILDLIK